MKQQRVSDAGWKEYCDGDKYDFDIERSRILDLVEECVDLWEALPSGAVPGTFIYFADLLEDLEHDAPVLRRYFPGR